MITHPLICNTIKQSKVAVTGSVSWPSPRLLEEYTLADIPVELEHTALKSNTLL